MFPVAWPSLSRNTVAAQAGEAAVGRAAAMGAAALRAEAQAALRAVGEPEARQVADAP
jgi:hypothetical protein